MSKKILFIIGYPLNKVPGQRFRFEQYLNYLRANGFECTMSPLFSETEINILYKKGHFLKKIFALLKGVYRRIIDVLRAKQFDGIFIFREAFILGPPLFEYFLSLTKVPMVFDFDDSIWLQNVSAANKNYGVLKNSKKTSKIISLVDMVFAGNNYLAEYAKKWCQDVKIIPTTIDTDLYAKGKLHNQTLIQIGWSGSHSTIKHFELAIPFLKILKKKYGSKINFRVIGDENYVNEELEIRGLPWRKESELEDLSTIDIGIMPLENDAWSKGKCGLKGLQYMGLCIPTLMSPVGVNNEIIKDGVNGFLPKSTEDWVEKISALIESKALREEIGLKGRETVEKNYSYYSLREKYLCYFSELVSRSKIKL